MKPLDPRLLRYARASRSFLAFGGVIGFTQTLMIVAFAWLLSQAITRAIDGAPLDEIARIIGALAGVIVLRAVLVWLQELVATRGAAQVKSQLRRGVMSAIARRGPDWLAGSQAARVTTVTTTGLDALDNYFARYLPQLILTAVATPILLVVVLWSDVLSGITMIIVLPLIPIFMILIGWATRAVQQQQWETLQRLSAGFLDLIGGLATLKIFGREKRQFGRLRSITDDYRVHTMKVLRVSFLSGFVLELAASLSVAIVAVEIGLRLLDGRMLLATGLFVLLLAPEVFLPIRNVGAQFHAAADGIAAADEVFAILDEGSTGSSAEASASAAPPVGTAGTIAGGGDLRFRGVTIDRGPVTVVDKLDADFRPGTLSVIAGPSGVGKSTLVGALLGFVTFGGEISLGGEPLAPGTSRNWLAWAGQRPGLFAGTIADNISLGDETPDAAAVVTSLSLAGGSELSGDTVLGVNGAGLSGGQAQRVAVARAMYRVLTTNCSVLVCDEPSSALDTAAEAALIEGFRTLAAQGRIVIVVSHRPAVLNAADQLVRLGEIVNVHS
ncbi:thiol reductant ABC exporter subunit CydD [Leifsonia sp. A12D58]|uniref:thiol reductant ABC exporter subunit CydD n=1 Tax=Leifsonia sp. A12D58 TaxID=3397674 RepID=UPI0039E02707